MSSFDNHSEIEQRVLTGGAPKYHHKNAEQKKLFARERIRLLLDEGSFVEDARLANNVDKELPADGVITGTGTIDGRVVAVMATDSTIKAGSWGARTVEKTLRIQETAEDLLCPLFYLVDSAGARITDQVEMFPGRRGAGRIFYNQVGMSGQIPQVCLLFGPSAAGGAYIPAFCDIVVMVDGNANMDRRIEAVSPILDPVHRGALRDLLALMWQDNRQAWDLAADGRYVQRQPATAEVELATHRVLVEHYREVGRLTR